jgi:hypothetical protein
MSRTKTLGFKALIVAITVTSPAVAVAVSVQPISSVMLSDSNNKRLGIYSYADNSVLMLFDQTIQPVRVNKGGFANEWEALFATPDCTGTPYVLTSEVISNSNDLINVTLYKQIGAAIWVGDQENATTAITILSQGNFDQCLRNKSLPAPGTSVIPLTELVDLNTIFTPPFHLIAK